MKIKEVFPLLMQGINDKIKEYGFEFKKNDKTFKRSSNSFIQIFDLLLTKTTEGITVVPTIRIKSKEIEAIYHSVSKKEPQYFDGTSCIGYDLFKIKSYFDMCTEIDYNEQNYYLIKEVKEVEILVNVISEEFISYGIRYFDENSSIERIDYLLNKYPREISIHNWLYPLRACLAIIAAKLNNNPRFKELIQIYREELVDAVYPYNEEFDELIRKVLI